MTRQQRKLEAKMNEVEFEPQYNGESPISYEEYFKVGTERYNNKFVTIKAVEVDESTMESDVIDTTAKTKGLWSRTKRLFKKR